MIETVTKPSISQLLAPDASVVYNIPRYQREYTWGQSHWEDLFDDIMENSEGYFLGSIIVIDHGHNPQTGITEIEVIDGQQRLTTISLLLCCLYNRINQYRTDIIEDEEQFSSLLNLKNRLVLKGHKGKTRLVPQVQNSNLGDYRALLSDYAGLEVAENKPKKAGLRRIYKAFRYFDKRVGEIVDNEKVSVKDYIDGCFKLVQRITSAVMVQINVSTHSDAYVLFESLNNRGVPLTAVDLIKNTLLASLGDDNDQLDASFNQWQSMLTLLGDDYVSQERFFRQNYDAFRREVNQPFATETSRFPLGAVATKSNLLSIYETQIKHNPQQTLRTLFDHASTYSKIILVDTDDLDPALEEALSDLAHVQGVPSYLLLLHLSQKRDEFFLEDEDLADICSLLVRFFVRRNLTDTPPTRDLTRLFIRICEELDDSNLQGRDVIDDIRKKLMAVSADDDMFKKQLTGPIYDTNPDTTRYILAALAKPSVTKEMKGLWERIPSGTYVWTIEHIFPQGTNIPEAWVGMIADGDYQRARGLQEEYVHTLGNLTLTGYNSTLSNLSFAEKKSRKDKDGNSVGYLNGLNINEYVAAQDSWTIDRIEERTNALVEDAMKLFAL